MLSSKLASPGTTTNWSSLNCSSKCQSFIHLASSRQIGPSCSVYFPSLVEFGQFANLPRVFEPIASRRQFQRKSHQRCSIQSLHRLETSIHELQPISAEDDELNESSKVNPQQSITPFSLLCWPKPSVCNVNAAHARVGHTIKLT